MSSRFRIQHRDLSIMEKELITQIKLRAEELDNLFKLAEAAPDTTLTTEMRDRVRQAALSRTNLEQAVMWGVKAITG